LKEKCNDEGLDTHQRRILATAASACHGADDPQPRKARRNTRRSGGDVLRPTGSDVAAGLADMESLRVMALANPNLVARLKTGTPFNDVRSHLFYAVGTAEGYIDYPALAAT